jgi:hypothetical protein
MLALESAFSTCKLLFKFLILAALPTIVMVSVPENIFACEAYGL